MRGYDKGKEKETNNLIKKIFPYAQNLSINHE